jgi:hypothetical protein
MGDNIFIVDLGSLEDCLSLILNAEKVSSEASKAVLELESNQWLHNLLFMEEDELDWRKKIIR